jgi:hypothetical protein
MATYDENGTVIGLPPFIPIPHYDRPYNYSAEDVVDAGWQLSQSYSTVAFNTAIGFLNEIGTISTQISDLPDISATVGEVTTTLTPMDIPAAPVRPDGMDLNLPAVPVEPTLATVAPLELGNAPEFAAVSPEVDLSIAAPAPLDATLPVAPELNAVVLPDAATLDLPASPDLLPLDLPGVPSLNLPVFDASVPDAPLAPDVGSFSFAESAYTSDLLTSLRTMLQTWVDGAATGIDPAVEQAIWLRGRERESSATQRKLREITRDFARRGFSKPQGAQAVALADALQEIQHRDAELSREVMVKQADLEQSNRRFAFEQAWQVESGLITYTSQIAQRAFEAAKFALQIGLEVFQARVAQYDAQIKAFGVQAEVFRAQLQGELARLEIFKAQIESQKLIGEINIQAVEIYKARIDAAKARIDVYRTQVEAASVIATVNRTVIEAYSARVGAYEALVKAKSAEYDGYATRIKAEVSKVDVFRAQADAYRSQVEGFSALVNARSAEKAIELKIKQEAPIDLFKARTEAFRSQVGAESDRVRALASIFQAENDAFGSQVQAQAARAGAEATMFRAESDVNVAEANIRIESAKANIARLVQQVTLLSENVRAGAQVSAQLAAAALSQVNLSAGMSVSESSSTNDSNVNSSSTSHSFSETHSFQHDT